MFFNILFTTIVSVVTIFVVHSIFNYLKNTLTVRKTKDLIYKPKYEYNKINDLIYDKNDSISSTKILNEDNLKTDYSSSEKNNIIDSQQIKSELKDFFKELNNNYNNNSDFESYNNNNIGVNF